MPRGDDGPRVGRKAASFIASAAGTTTIRQVAKDSEKR